MLPLSLFKVRNFSIGNVATAAIYGGLSLATFLLVIFLQQVSGYSALQAGLALLPVTAVMFLLSSRIGALAGKFGPRLFMAAGPIIMGLGFLLMLRVQAHSSYVSDLLPGVLVFALGLASTVSPLTSAVLSDVDARHAGVASAVNNAISRIAGLITIAVAGVLVGDHLNVVGFHHALIAVAAVLVTGGAISYLGIRNHQTQKSPRTV
jgi:predicted MFS family arabinose efflux permease